MNPIALVAAAVGAIGLLIILTALPARRGMLRERLEQALPQAGSLDAYKVTYTWDDDEEAEADTSSKAGLDVMRDRLHSLDKKYARLSGYAQELADADIRLHPSEWYVAVFGAGLVLGFLIEAKSNSLLGFVIGLVVAYFGSGMVVRMRQRKRSKAFDKQLGDTLMLLANALKAGYGFDMAMQSVAHEAVSPIKEEFTRYCREVALGLPSDLALVNMLDRNKSFDLSIAVSAVQIHRQVGGNLSEVLETIAETIRERVKTKQEINTLTAQARFSGYLISVLPLALGALLSVIAPDYFTPMFSSSIGIGMLIAAGFLIFIGYMMIRVIVNIDA